MRRLLRSVRVRDGYYIIIVLEYITIWRAQDDVCLL